MTLKQRIQDGPLLLDGGMGSQLIVRGVPVRRCNDSLCIESPDVVRAIHQDYIDAGSDIVITNTFGANAVMLARHDLAECSAEINQAAVQCARQAAGDAHFVLGDIGPCGDFLAPLGTLEPERLREAFGIQARALIEGGADGLIVETMSALDELAIAVEAARAAARDRPVFASMAFDRTVDGFRTMMGVDVSGMVKCLTDLRVDALGFNCGTATLDEYELLADLLVEAVGRQGVDVALFAEPNAGSPELVDGEPTWSVTPERFAQTQKRIHARGVRILGGCCGTTPDFIRAMAEAFK